MTLTWSWEEMDYIGEPEPRLLPDLWIEPGAKCEYCGEPETGHNRLAVLCGQCGGVAHFLCAVDCAPYDTSEEYNDFVFGKCLKWTPEDAAKHKESLTTPHELAPALAASASSSDDFDPFLDSDDLP